MNRLQASATDMKEVVGEQYENVSNYLESGNYYQELNVEANGSFSGMKISVAKGRVNLYNASIQKKMQQYMQSMFSSIPGVSVEVGKTYEDTLAGQKYQVMDVNIDASGYPMRATLFVRSEGRYSIMIVIADVNESTSDLVEGFVKYK